MENKDPNRPDGWEQRLIRMETRMVKFQELVSQQLVEIRLAQQLLAVQVSKLEENIWL